MIERLLRWFIFSVVIALLPLAFNYLSLMTRGEQASIEALIGRGELLLVTAALCAAAVGSLLGTGTKQKIFKIISGGGSIIILLSFSIVLLRRYFCSSSLWKRIKN